MGMISKTSKVEEWKMNNISEELMQTIQENNDSELLPLNCIKKIIEIEQKFPSSKDSTRAMQEIKKVISLHVKGTEY